MTKLARLRTLERRIARRIVKREAQRRSLRDNVTSSTSMGTDGAPVVRHSENYHPFSNDERGRINSLHSPIAFTHTPATLYSFPAHTKPAAFSQSSRQGRQSSYPATIHPLRSIRVQQKLTLEELAQRSGLSPSYLSRLEAGTRRLNVDTISRLAEALECNPRDLLAENPSNNWEKLDSAQGAEISGQEGDRFEQGNVSPFSSNSHLYIYETNSQAPTIDYTKPIAPVACPAQLLGVPGAYAIRIGDESYLPRYQQGDQLFLHPGRPLGPSSTAVVVTMDHTLIIGDFVGWKPSTESPSKEIDLKADEACLALELRPLSPHLLGADYRGVNDNTILLHPSQILSIAKIVSVVRFSRHADESDAVMMSS